MQCVFTHIRPIIRHLPSVCCQCTDISGLYRHTSYTSLQVKIPHTHTHNLIQSTVKVQKPLFNLQCPFFQLSLPYVTKLDMDIRYGHREIDIEI